jgi:hypothetical protein
MDRAAMLTRQHGAELLVVHVLELTEDALAARVKRFSPLPANARLIEIARRELCSDLRDAGDSVTIDVLLAAFGVLHVDDRRPLRATKAVAARKCPRASSALEGPCRRLRGM